MIQKIYNNYVISPKDCFSAFPMHVLTTIDYSNNPLQKQV